MTYENFLKIILKQEVLDEQIKEAYKLKIDLIEFVDRYHEIITILIKEIYGEDGYEWYSWFCYENDYGRKDWGVKGGEIQYGATDENGNPICHSFKSLWEYLEQNCKVKECTVRVKKSKYVSVNDFNDKINKIFKNIFNKS
jgi:hypothetical protein